MSRALNLDERRILDICRDIEFVNEQIYRFFAARFPHEKGLSELWKKTADEEVTHALKFDIAIKSRKSIMVSESTTPVHIVTAFKYVHAVLDNVKRNPPTIGESLQMAIALEERLSNLHVGCDTNFNDMSIRSLFKEMLEHDKAHIGVLREARQKYAAPGHG